MPLFCSAAPQHPIITGEPNELVAQIHPRMPVILPEQHHAAWLGETDDGNLKALLLPYPADQTTSPNSVHYPLGALTPQPR